MYTNQFFKFNDTFSILKRADEIVYKDMSSHSIRILVKSLSGDLIEVDYTPCLGPTSLKSTLYEMDRELYPIDRVSFIKTSIFKKIKDGSVVSILVHPPPEITITNVSADIYQIKIVFDSELFYEFSFLYKSGFYYAVPQHTLFIDKVYNIPLKTIEDVLFEVMKNQSFYENGAEYDEKVYVKLEKFQKTIINEIQKLL